MTELSPWWQLGLRYRRQSGCGHCRRDRFVIGLFIATALAASAAPALAVVPTEENIDTLVGQHFTTNYQTLLHKCPPDGCLGQFETIKTDTGFTVTGIARSEKYRFELRAKVRLDDGRTGFLDLTGSWRSDGERADIAVAAARFAADCRARASAEIGMTEQEIRASKWGQPDHINTTMTASYERAQWVYEYGPICREGEHGLKSGYLYFENGRLVAIQR